MLSRSRHTYKVVFVRHGQSQWNFENRFTGWSDVDLTKLGREEAKQAGNVMKEQDFHFDVAHTSLLTRAIDTYSHIADEMGITYIPRQKTWRLNERHYGALEGFNKAETAEKYGKEQVKAWRRAYDVPPPGLADNDERNPKFDNRYNHLPTSVLPRGESLKKTIERVLPYWYETICPQVLEGQNVIVVAHCNSLRAIVKHLAGVSDEDIVRYEIPTGCPLVFEFDRNLLPTQSYYLVDQEELKQRMKVASKLLG